MSETLSLNPFQTHLFTKRNNLKPVVGREADTFEILAQEFGKKVWELYKFNDQSMGDQPKKMKWFTLNKNTKRH